MWGKMVELLLATAVFVGGHFAVSSTPLRPWLVAEVGERVYLLMYAVLAAVTLVWMIIAYGRADFVELWPFHAHGVRLTLVLMLPAVLLVVLALASPNPTAAGVPDEVLGADAARGIFRITRHPFMWGVGLWAFAHLAPNGDLASLILFGGLAILALLGTHFIDLKFEKKRPDAWPAFAAVTSNLPFAAIAAGRQHLSLAEIGAEIGWWRLGLAVVVYLLLVIVHPWLIGVDPLAVF
jgi:uncharacterized membrane protein